MATASLCIRCLSAIKMCYRCYRYHRRPSDLGVNAIDFLIAHYHVALHRFPPTQASLATSLATSH